MYDVGRVGALILIGEIVGIAICMFWMTRSR
jgi:hypothetical protein